jgi:hypothetical protein
MRNPSLQDLKLEEVATLGNKIANLVRPKFQPKNQAFLHDLPYTLEVSI